MLFNRSQSLEPFSRHVRGCGLLNSLDIAKNEDIVGKVK